MTPEAQRIAIAEACGWKIEMHSTGRMRKVYDGRTVPDYLNSLDAIHSGEKSLTSAQLHKFNLLLDHVIVVGDKDEHWSHGRTAESYKWHATAAQRCEAFLKTIGKWEEGQ